MPQPTIFFCTNTGSNSDHADFIQRVCNEISTPSFTKQFRAVSSLTSDPIDILQKLDTYKDEVSFFYFSGREEHFVALLDVSLRVGYGSLFDYLTHLPKLDLVFLSYCSREQFVQPLLDGGIQTVVSTSHHLPKAQATTFAAVFCQQYLIAGLTTQAAYAQALSQAGIAPGKQERQMAGLHGSPTLRLRRWWEYPGLEPHIIGELEPHIVGKEAPTSLTQLLPPCPFPGARAYKGKEASVFFGRDTELDTLYKYLTTPRLRSILLLHGQAGVGKTSLLRAGLLPRIRQRYRLRCYSGRKTTYLFKALCQEVQPSDPNKITQQDWTTWLVKTGHDLLLVLDQLETQLLTKEPKLQADFARFMAAIHTLVVNPACNKKPRVIFSLREESLLALQAFLNRHHLQSRVYDFALKPLDDEGLRKVLRNFTPASALAIHYQFTIEDKLAERMVTDMTQDQHSAIGPFLQPVLKKLWRETAGATSGPQSLQYYQQLYHDGTLLCDFFAARLEKVCRLYPPVNRRNVIALLFTYTPFAGTDCRRVATTREPQPTITNRLKDFYLLTEKAGEQGSTFYLGHKLLAMPISQQFYQVVHKGTWLERRKADLDFMIERITNSTFPQRTKIPSCNKPLPAPPLTSSQQYFRVGGCVLLLAAFFAVTFLPLLYKSLETVLQRGTNSTANQLLNLAAQPNSTPSVMLLPTKSLEPSGSLEPIDRSSGIELKRVALLYASDALPVAHTSRHSTVLAFSSDSALLFAGGGDNTLEIWSVVGADAHPSLVVPTQAAPVTTIHIQGNLLIYTTADGGVGHLRLDALGRVDPAQRDEPIELLRHQGAVTAVQVSGDGNLLVTGGEDGALYQYDLSTRQSHAFIHDPANPITAVALHPNNAIIAYAGANQVITLLARSTGAIAHQLTGHTGRVNSLEFSPDGAHLLSAGSDGAVCIWQVTNAVRDYCFVDLTAAANIARYSQDGALIIAARGDGFLWVWDAASYRLLDTVAAHPGGISALALRADGRQLATTGWNSDIVLWDINLPLRSLQ